MSTAGEITAAASGETWGVDSEYGRLRDVLLCPPDHFQWRATSPISEKTLSSGRRFESERACAQHAELVSCYEEHGVRCHFIEPDPMLPYQVFARDSSAPTPGGGAILQLQQPWRRGEHAAALRSYERAGIPIRGVITAGPVEGGDVMVIEPGCLLIGCGEARTGEAGARQLASWFEADGWEVRIEPFPARYVHIDVLVATLAEKLAAVCVDAVSGGLVAWLRGKGFDIVEVPEHEAFELGVNAISLGDDHVVSSVGATTLNGALRAAASPSWIPTCRCSRSAAAVRTASRRRSVAIRSAEAKRMLDARPARVIADLDRLAEVSGGPAGARRVAWTPGWVAARDLLRERVAAIGLECEADAAGNLWVVVPGRRAETVVVGSHLDSVPEGGPLDGALGVFAGLELLRTLRRSGTPPERSVALVDWADEEGARFGRSLLGSSAVAGTLDADSVREASPPRTARCSRMRWPRTVSTSTGPSPRRPTACATPAPTSSCTSSRGRCSITRAWRSRRSPVPSASSARA